MRWLQGIERPRLARRFQATGRSFCLARPGKNTRPDNNNGEQRAKAVRLGGAGLVSCASIRALLFDFIIKRAVPLIVVRVPMTNGGNHQTGAIIKGEGVGRAAPPLQKEWSERRRLARRFPETGKPFCRLRPEK